MSVPTISEEFAKPNELADTIYDSEIGYAYNPTTGRLWRIREAPTTVERRYDNRIVTSKLNCIGNIAKPATHIMYKIMMGHWPQSGMMIDHKDGDVENMLWNNLREATPSQNAYNKASPGRWNNASIGMEVGVYKEHNRFVVSIGGIYYGRFDSAEVANAFALEKRKELHGEFASTSRSI